VYVLSSKQYHMESKKPKNMITVNRKNIPNSSFKEYSSHVSQRS
jgi:hypothetical protein